MLVTHLHPFVVFMRDLPRRNFIRQSLDVFTIENGVNTNLLLYCFWYGLAELGRLKKPDFKRLQAALHPWHERICLELQHLSASLNTHLAAKQWVEEEAKIANQLEQQMLAEALPVSKKMPRNHQQQLTDACMNGVTYFKSIHFHLDKQSYQSIVSVLSVLFADYNLSEIQNSLEQALNTVKLEGGGLTQLTLV